jgi:hypothetical protein
VSCRAEVIAVLAFEIEPRLKTRRRRSLRGPPPAILRDELDPRTLNPEK